MRITDNKNSFNVRPEVLVCLFLALSTLVVYLQVGTFDFTNYDTGKYVYENKLVKAGLTVKGIKWAFTTTYFSNWHPLTWLSHMLDVQLYGLRPGRHHLTNVLLHIVNTLLLFGILRRMTGALWQSSFVAALFALHPLHIESVAWVAERKDLLSTLFGFLALWYYVPYARSPGIGRYLPIFLLFILGLMAKPMIVTWPFVLLLLDYWPLQRFKFKTAKNADDASNHIASNFFLIAEKMPLLIVSAASCIVTIYAQRAGGSMAPLDKYPLHIRFANALISYVSYIGKMLWPENLAVIYPYNRDLPAWQVLAALFLIAGMTALAMKYIKTRPWYIVGWLWYLGTLVPVIGLVQVGMQAMADRYTYVPLIGMFIIIAWGLSDLLEHWRYKKLGIAAIALAAIGLLMAISWKQVGYWKSSTTLFKRAIEVTENNFVAWNNLGHGLLMDGKFTEAIAHFKKSSEINPRFVLAHLNMGLALAEQNRLEDALQSYAIAVHVKPDFVITYNLMGKTQDRLGNTEQAVSNFRQAIKIDPEFSEPYRNLANLMFRLGNHGKAYEYYRQAVKVDPYDAESYYDLGNYLYRMDKPDAALPNFLQAIKISPKLAEAYNSAGAALIRMGEARKAVAFFREAVRIDPDYAAAQKNLKNTLAALAKIQ